MAVRSPACSALPEAMSGIVEHLVPGSKSRAAGRGLKGAGPPVSFKISAVVAPDLGRTPDA
jgi:hypothetical protein